MTDKEKGADLTSAEPHRKFIERRVLSWEDIYAQVETVAKQLVTAQLEIDSVLTIARGGLVPTALLMHALKIREPVSVITGILQGSRILYHLAGLEGIYEHRILLIDDICDTGLTFHNVNKFVPHKALHRVALYVKPAGKPLTQFYGEEVPQDRWLVFPWENE